MKITIPEHIGEITLGQYQKYHALTLREDLDAFQFNKRKIEIFCNVKRIDLDKIKQTDYEDIVSQIDIALNQSVEFEPIFSIQDIEFGFIPNLDKITGGEYRDLTIYGMDIDKMHNLMAVLFRPIKKKDILDNYTIISYQGTEQYANIMKSMPLSIVNGALVFFSSLANELLNYTRKYMEVVQVREEAQMTTLINGDGMQQSMN